MKTLGKLIYEEHLHFLKKLNNTYIISEQIQDISEFFIGNYDTGIVEDDAFSVPPKKGGKGKYAYRTPQEMLSLWESYQERGFYCIFLNQIVSDFEDYLSKCLYHFFKYYPAKLTTTVPGVQSISSIDVKTVIESGDFDSLIDTLIHKNFETIFYAEPRKYLEYFKKVLSIEFNKDVVDQFCEIKATRDLIVHSEGKINSIYLKKSGSNARGKLGKKIKIDSQYFSDSISVMKVITGEIRKQISEKFPIK